MNDSARTVERALEVLLAAAESNGQGCSISELARLVHLPRPNIYRLVGPLQAKGFLQRVPGDRHRYQLGLRLLDLGERVKQGLNLRQVALPYMKELSDRTGESVYLAVRDGWEGVIIERVEASRNLRLFTGVGSRIPLHGGASAKVLLAWAPSDEVEAMIRAGLRRRTPHTITDPERLRAHLAQIRRNGYALSHSELDDGATGIGAPIRDSANEVVAGLSLAGATDRFRERAMRQLIAEVVRAAQHVSAALGAGQTGRARAGATAGRTSAPLRGC